MTAPAHRLLDGATSAHAAGYTPSHVDAASRMAELLRRYYPNRTRDECRAALARMYGHADWRSLETSVGSGPASRYDEDEPHDVVESRCRLHYESALACLAGVTDETKTAAARLDEEVLTPGGASIGRRYDPVQIGKRVARARFAYDLVYAAYAVLEIRPTARQRLAIADNDETVPLVQRVDLLPRALPAWIRHHRPYLMPHAKRIAELRVRQHCVTDLMRFSFLWGELCAHHSGSLPKPLQIYPIAACTKWLARVSPLHAGEAAGTRVMADLAPAAERLQRCAAARPGEEETRFILTQPREDFRLLSASAREQQMRAGHALLRRHMEDAASRPGAGALCARTATAMQLSSLARAG